MIGSTFKDSHFSKEVEIMAINYFLNRKTSDSSGRTEIKSNNCIIENMSKINGGINTNQNSQ